MALENHRDEIANLKTRATNLENAVRDINLGLIAGVGILDICFEVITDENESSVNLISMNNGAIGYSCPRVNGVIFENDITTTSVGALKFANMTNRKIELEAEIVVVNGVAEKQYNTGLQVLNSYSGNFGDMPDSFDICILEAGDVIKNTSLIKARVI